MAAATTLLGILYLLSHTMLQVDSTNLKVTHVSQHVETSSKKEFASGSHRQLPTPIPRTYTDVTNRHRQSKPRLVGTSSKQSKRGEMKTVRSLHCEKCIDQLKSVKHFCSLQYHYGMEVRVHNRTEDGYFVQVIEVFHHSTRMHGYARHNVRSQLLHLRLPASSDPTNIAFSNCHCTHLHGNRTYIAFGHLDKAGTETHTLSVHHKVDLPKQKHVAHNVRVLFKKMFQACNPVEEQKPEVKVSFPVVTEAPSPSMNPTELASKATHISGSVSAAAGMALYKKSVSEDLVALIKSWLTKTPHDADT